MGAALLAAATPASAATLSVDVLTQRPAATNGTSRLHNLVAGYGYVGWLERSARGGRSRIVLEHEGQTRRSEWMSGNVAIGLARRVDDASGRSVVRLQLVRKPAARAATTTLLLPSTLRPSNARWVPLPAPMFGESASDGEDGQIVSVTTEPEIDVPPARLTGGRAAPTQCRVSLSPGPNPFPVLPDCSIPGIAIRNGLVALWAGVPSASGDGSERGQTYLTALNLFSLAHPERGWRRLATNRSGYEGDAGLQDACLLDDGAAVVEGTQAELEDNDPSTWTLRFVPADPAATGWTAPASALGRDPFGSHPSSVACDGRRIYGLHSKVVGAGKRAKITTRVVRLIPKL